MNDPKIIVALDFAEDRQALEFVQKISPEQCRLKVGKELFTSCGPALVEQLVGRGYDVFPRSEISRYSEHGQAGCECSGETRGVDAERACAGRQLR